jgi:UDP:flavonoid glycosyltransferase YjiC (YdhE family)
MGSRGDVQPALSLALALRDAGHDVRVSAPPDFAAWAEELGLAFASAGASIEGILKRHADRMGANPITLGRAIREILLQHVPAMTERTLAAAQGVDAIVSANQFLSRTVAEVLRVPFLGVIYAPTLIRSASHPPMIARWQTAPRWVNRLLWKAGDRMASRIFLEPINIERGEAGVGCGRVVRGPRLWRRALHARLRSGGRTVPAGLVARRRRHHGSVVLRRSLRARCGRKRVPRRGAAAGLRRLRQHGERGCRRRDPAPSSRARALRGGVCSSARVWAGLGSEAAAERVKVVKGPMPHAKLFPRVAAVVHHGGSGTTSAALRAGVPQVIVPHMMDQYYFCAPPEGAGDRPGGHSVRKLNPARLAAAIDAALQLPPAPRLEAAERLRPADGLKRAVALIEQRVDRAHPRV